MGSTEQPRPLLPGLAGIRFFAAIHVCLHHLAQMGYALAYEPNVDTPGVKQWGQDIWHLFSSNDVVLAILRGALIQVGMFFVMSGFILTYSHPIPASGRFPYRDYALARVARVYAMYLIGLLVTLPIFYFFVTLPQKTERQLPEAVVEQRIASDDPYAPTRLRSEPVYSTGEKVLAGVATPLLLQAWFPRLTIFPWNPPAWSLSVEAFAYLVFPFMALWMLRLSTRALISFAVFCYAAVLIAPIWYITTDPDQVGTVYWNDNLFWFNFVRHNPLFRLPEFLIGMVIGRIYSEQAAENARTGKKTGGWMSTTAVLFVLVFLMFSDRLFGPSTSYMLLHNGLLAPVFAFGLVGLALGGGPVGYICSRKWCVLLGESAYAIYMLHFPYLAYSLVVISEDAKKGKPTPSAIGYTIAFLVAITLISALVHKKWEVPWRRKIRSFMVRLWPAPTG